MHVHYVNKYALLPQTFFFGSHSYMRKNHLPRGDACLYNIFVWLEHSLELLLLCREKYFNVSILYKQLFSASNDVAVVRSHQLSHVFLSIHFWKDIWYNFAIILSVQRECLVTKLVSSHFGKPFSLDVFLFNFSYLLCRLMSKYQTVWKAAVEIT